MFCCILYSLIEQVTTSLASDGMRITQSYSANNPGAARVCGTTATSVSNNKNLVAVKDINKLLGMLVFMGERPNQEMCLQTPKSKKTTEEKV